jgi:hypothetical protein
MMTSMSHSMPHRCSTSISRPPSIHRFSVSNDEQNNDEDSRYHRRHLSHVPTGVYLCRVERRHCARGVPSSLVRPGLPRAHAQQQRRPASSLCCFVSSTHVGGGPREHVRVAIKRDDDANAVSGALLDASVSSPRRPRDGRAVDSLLGKECPIDNPVDTGWHHK